MRAFNVQRDVGDRLRHARRADRPLLRAGQRPGLHRDRSPADRASAACGTLVITGPSYSRVDLSAVKRVRIAAGTNFEFRAEMLNAFNHPNFTPVISTGTGADGYRTTSVVENSSRIIQFGFRLNWP